MEEILPVVVPPLSNADFERDMLIVEALAHRSMNSRRNFKISHDPKDDILQSMVSRLEQDKRFVGFKFPDLIEWMSTIRPVRFPKQEE